jgi:heat shock protein HslJ
MTTGEFRNLSVGRRLVVTALLITTVACSRGGRMEDDPAARAAWTAQQLANATYSGITSDPVTLTDGRWEGDPFVEGGASRPAVGLLDHFILTGDLDNDGTDEVAVLLWESSGGSGTRLHLAAMGERDGVITNLATTLIGDRVQVRSGGVEDGLITLDVLRAGPEDAACCPTEKALVSWSLTGGGLDLVGEERTGTLSLADLEGREWVLVGFGWDEPVSDDAGITLVFEEGRVSGHAGCNSYFAGTVASDPGALGFNGMGATRMACPETVMSLERRYLKTLAGASRYSFIAGRLVLSCDTDEGTQNLVFTPRGDPSAKPETI